jgi:hypothetical protein
VADIDKVIRRPSEYLAETGVPQLLGGAVFFFFGSSVLIQHVLPKGFMDEEILGWISICCAGAALLGARTLKRRIVFPRGGYVEPRSHPAVRFTSVAVFAAGTALAIFAIAWPGRLPRLPLMHSRFTEPGFAIAFAIMCLAAGWQQKSTSRMVFGFYLVGLAPLLWLPERGIERQAWLEVGVGAPLVVAGAIRLRSFLKANPRPLETTNG